MASQAELQFILKMRDEASAVLAQHASAVQGAGGSYKSMAAAAEGAQQSLGGLVNKAKEAAEAVSAIWASSELAEKTLGAFSEMEVAMVRVQAAAGLTKDELDNLGDSIEDLAKNSLDQTNEQIAGVAKSAAQLGIVGVSGIKAYTQTVSQLATVTGMSVQAVEGGMAQILAATNEVQNGAKAFGDAFDVLANKTRGGGQVLTQTAEQLSMMTAGMKISAEQVLGLASSLDNLGLRSQRAAMAIGQTMNQIDSVVSKGGPALQGLAVSVGMSVDQFKKLEQENPAEALNKFLGVVNSIQKSGGNVQEFLKQFQLGGREMEVSILAAAKSVDKLKASEAAAQNAINSGALGKDAAKYADTFQEALHGVVMELKDMGEAIGKAASPAFTGALQSMSGMLSTLSSAVGALPGPLKDIGATLLIAVPMVVAFTTAWRLVNDVILSGLGTFRGLYGAMGDVVRGVQAMVAAEEEAVAVTGALEKEVAGLATAETGLAAESRAAAVGIATVTDALSAQGVAATVAQGRMAGVMGTMGMIARGGLGVGIGAAIGVPIGGAIGGAIGGYLNKQDDNSMLGKTRDWIADQRDNGSWYNPLHAIGQVGNAMGFQSPAHQQAEKMIQQQLQNSTGMAGAHAAAEEGMRGAPPPTATAAAGGQTQDAGTSQLGQAVTSLDSLDKTGEKQQAVDVLQKQLDLIKQAHNAGKDTGDIDKARLTVLQNIVTAQKEALDPMNKLRQQWQEQLTSASAVTKQQQNQAAIAKEIATLKQSDPRFTAANATEVTQNMQAIQAAQATAEFTKQAKALQDQIQIAQALTNQERQAVTIEQEKTKAIEAGMSALQAQTLAYGQTIKANLENVQNLQARLNPQAGANRQFEADAATLKSAADAGVISAQEYQREMQKLASDTLAARSPLAQMVQDQQDLAAQAQVTGVFHDADLKTLQEMQQYLKQHGEAMPADAQAAQTAYNRAQQQITQINQTLTTVENDFESGLTNAIDGALQGTRGSFTQAARQFGVQMFNLGFKNLFNMALNGSGLNNMITNGLGLTGQASAATGALSKAASAQTALTTANATITATNVTLMGGGSLSGIAGASPTGAALPGAASGPTAVDVNSVGGQTLSTGALPVAPAASVGVSGVDTAAATASAVPALGALSAAGGAAALIGRGGGGAGAVIPTTNIGSLVTSAGQAQAAAKTVGADLSSAGAGATQQATSLVSSLKGGFSGITGMFGKGGAVTTTVDSGTTATPASTDFAGLNGSFAGVPGVAASPYGALPSASAFGGVGQGSNVFGLSGPNMMPQSGLIGSSSGMFNLQGTGLGGIDMTRAYNNLSPSSINTEMISHLQSQYGITPEQAAGIAGNGAMESKGFSAFNQQGGPAKGMFQWEGDRQQGLMNYAQENKLSPDSFAANQGYLDKELSGSIPGQNYSGIISYMKAHPEMTTKQSSDYFEQNFEKAGKPNLDSRQAYSEQSLQQWQQGKDQMQLAQPQSFAEVGQATQQMQAAEAQIKQMGTATQSMTQNMTKAVPDMTQMSSGITKMGTDVTTAVPNLSSMSGGLTQMTSGLTSAVPATTSFTQSLSSMTQSMTSSMGGMGGGGGIFSMFGGMHSGGLVGGWGMYSTMHAVSPAVFAGARRFHDGLNTDEYPAILQRGERVLTANDAARTQQTLAHMTDALNEQNKNAAARAAGMGSNTGMGRSVTQHMTMNINTPNADSFRKSKSQLMADMGTHMNRAGGMNG